MSFGADDEDGSKSSEGGDGRAGSIFERAWNAIRTPSMLLLGGAGGSRHGEASREDSSARRGTRAGAPGPAPSDVSSGGMQTPPPNAAATSRSPLAGSANGPARGLSAAGQGGGGRVAVPSAGGPGGLGRGAAPNMLGGSGYGGGGGGMGVVGGMQAGPMGGQMGFAVGSPLAVGPAAGAAAQPWSLQQQALLQQKQFLQLQQQLMLQQQQAMQQRLQR